MSEFYATLRAYPFVRPAPQKIRADGDCALMTIPMAGTEGVTCCAICCVCCTTWLVFDCACI